MSQQVSLLLGGLAIGSLYALIGAGYAILLRSSHRFNFAHVGMVLLGGYLVFEANTSWHLGFWGGMVASAILTAAVGVIIYFLIAAPLAGRAGGLLAVAIATIGADAALRNGIGAYSKWSDNIEVGSPWGARTTSVLGANIYVSQLWVIGVTIVVVAIMVLVLSRTRAGLLFRAIAEDEEASAANGINVKLVLIGAWAVAGMLAALAGGLSGTFPRLLSAASTPEIALRAIPAVVIGGMGSIGGAIFGGYVIGLVEVYTARYLPNTFGSNFYLVMPYVVMVFVLLVRPQGLFGEKEVQRV